VIEKTGICIKHKRRTCVIDNIASLCDVYKFTIKNLIDLPKQWV